MVADPRWLEILKSSGGQAAAVAGACALFLLADRDGWMPKAEPWMVHAASFGLLLGALLTLVAVASALNQFFAPRTWLIHYWNRHNSKKNTRAYIPHMTEEERKIIAYLLAHNQKLFTGSRDGGHAATLISRKIVVMAFQPGQQAHPEDVPFAIPDEVWEVLVEHKDNFPYTPPRNGETEPYPWRVHWMAR